MNINSEVFVLSMSASGGFEWSNYWAKLIKARAPKYTEAVVSRIIVVVELLMRGVSDMKLTEQIKTDTFYFK